MAYYRKKPVIVEAMQYTGVNHSAVAHWMFPDIESDATGYELTIATLEGEMHASPGDYIIRGVKGEYYPCKPDVFAASYEPVDVSDISTKIDNAVAGIFPPTEYPGHRRRADLTTAVLRLPEWAACSISEQRAVLVEMLRALLFQGLPK